MKRFRKLIEARLALPRALLARGVLEREDGQTLAEYALILALIAVIAVLALIFLGGTITSLFSSVGNSV
jgi:Flp pilus assembly pilin Flp